VSKVNLLKFDFVSTENAAPVGAVPGITRSVMNRIKVKEDPPIFLFDTPGILSPDVRNVERGLRLALCGKLSIYYN